MNELGKMTERIPVINQSHHAQDTQLYLVVSRWPDCNWCDILEVRRRGHCSSVSSGRVCVRRLAFCTKVEHIVGRIVESRRVWGFSSRF